MTIVLGETGVSEKPSDEDLGKEHFVCHCNTDIGFCRIDLTVAPWVFPSNDPYNECALCHLVWSETPNSCPWGCVCDECRGF